MGLLSLPNEILEIALKCLLPPFRSQSLAETYVFTIPVDLLAVRLVSRRLHRIATPFAWRRAQLQIASPRPAAMIYGSYSTLGLKCTDPAQLFTATKTSFRSLVRCRFFQEHPELAAHVRVLLVSLEWHAENPQLARDALRAATMAMSSLRTVLVWDADVLAIKDIRQLLQRPLLRAVRLMDVDGSAFPAQCDWGAGLKMLHISNSVCPARLIAGAFDTLECVSIELARPCIATQAMPTLRDMPWKTLKEVALVDCVNEEDWFCFLGGFEEMRDPVHQIQIQAFDNGFDRRGDVPVFAGNMQTLPWWGLYSQVCGRRVNNSSWTLFLQLHKLMERPTVLTELLIGDLAGLSHDRINQLLHTFAGQPLTKLTLYHVLALDSLTVARIVQAFPTLHHLTLLTEGELAPWPDRLDAYIQHFARLPFLESLAWNNFSLDPVLAAAFPVLGDAALSTLYASHAHAVARRVRSLRCVKLTSATDCVVDTVYVKKGNSRVKTVDVRRSTEAALHTSSWSTTSEVFQDI